MSIWKRVFGNSREYLEEIKRQNIELFESKSLKKSSKLHVYLRGLSIPLLKRMAIQIKKDKNIKDGALIEYILNELESRIGHQELKKFCNEIYIDN